jgi:hypothetical protein
MTDANALSGASLRRDFTVRAKPPTEALQKATAFINTLQQKQKEGQAITDQERVRGERLSRQLDLRTEQFSFWGAITAGQSSPNEADMERQIEYITRTYDQAKTMVSRLRDTLKNFE